MGRPRVYPDEFRVRAVRLVHEWRKDRAVAEGGLQAVAERRQQFLRKVFGLFSLIRMDLEVASERPSSRMAGRVGKRYCGALMWFWLPLLLLLIVAI